MSPKNVEKSRKNKFPSSLIPARDFTESIVARESEKGGNGGTDGAKLSCDQASAVADMLDDMAYLLATTTDGDRNSAILAGYLAGYAGGLRTGACGAT